MTFINLILTYVIILQLSLLIMYYVIKGKLGFRIQNLCKSNSKIELFF